MSNLSRAFVSDIEVRADGIGRTVYGIVVPFDRVARVSDGGRPYQEMFQRGAFAKTIAERGDRVKLLSHHSRSTNPLGRATMLREDAAGLYGEFQVSNTRAGDEALELVRDGALDSFSVGFKPVQHVQREGVTVRTEVGMREASLVTFGAYDDGAMIAGVRLDVTDLTPEDLADLARMLREADLTDTPVREPSDQGTSSEAALVEGEPPAGHSARHTHRHLRAKAREEGGPLS